MKFSIVVNVHLVTFTISNSRSMNAFLTPKDFGNRDDNVTVSLENLIELPQVQSAKASFPPTCRVWILSTQSKSPSETHDSFSISEGTVTAVFVGDIFDCTRCIYYKIRDDSSNVEIVEESRLVFARSVPVNFFDGESSGARNGEVLSCAFIDPYDSTNVHVKVNYTILLFGNHGDGYLIKHGVRQQQLRFRLGPKSDLTNRFEPQLSDVHSAKSYAPPPGFAISPIGALTNASSLTKIEELVIPSWLVSNETDSEMVKSESVTVCQSYNIASAH